jgi:hypothetical protein
MLSGRRDSCLRSVPVSSKYIDLPENLFGIYPAAHIRFRAPPALLSAGMRVTKFVLYHAEALLRTPAIPWLRTTLPWLAIPPPRLQDAPFSTWYGRSFFAFSIFWNPFTQTFKLHEQKSPTTEPEHI